MKMLISFLLFACAYVFAAGKYSIDLNIDKQDGCYKVGEQVKFTVQLKEDMAAPCAGKKMCYSLDYEMGEDKTVAFRSEDKLQELSFIFDAATRIIISVSLLNVPGAGYFGVGFNTIKTYKNMLCLDINAHGIDNGRAAAYYEQIKQKIS